MALCQRLIEIRENGELEPRSFLPPPHDVDRTGILLPLGEQHAILLAGDRQGHRRLGHHVPHHLHQLFGRDRQALRMHGVVRQFLHGRGLFPLTTRAQQKLPVRRHKIEYKQMKSSSTFPSSRLASYPLWPRRAM